MKVGPGQSLSCPYSAHSGSRDLLRGLGGPPGEAGVGCGSLWGQGHWQQRTQGIFKLIYLLFLFLTFFKIYFLFLYFYIIFCFGGLIWGGFLVVVVFVFFAFLFGFFCFLFLLVLFLLFVLVSGFFVWLFILFLSCFLFLLFVLVFVCLFECFVLAVPQSLWHLGSPAGGWTWAPKGSTKSWPLDCQGIPGLREY